VAVALEPGSGAAAPPMSSPDDATN
jgi:hypothetical protein